MPLPEDDSDVVSRSWRWRSDSNAALLFCRPRPLRFAFAIYRLPSITICLAHPTGALAARPARVQALVDSKI